MAVVWSESVWFPDDFIEGGDFIGEKAFRLGIPVNLGLDELLVGVRFLVWFSVFVFVILVCRSVD